MNQFQFYMSASSPPKSPPTGAAHGHRNAQWFRGGLVFKAYRLVYHSTLGLKVIKKKNKNKKPHM